MKTKPAPTSTVVLALLTFGAAGAAAQSGNVPAPDTNYTIRIKYFAITPDHFRWRADGSSDGVRTRQRDLWKMEATRAR